MLVVVLTVVLDHHIGVHAVGGYQGAGKRPDVADDPHLSQIELRKASVRARVEHPFPIVKRDFGFTKTRQRGIAMNLNHLNVLFASATWVMRARAVALMGSRRGASLARTR